MTFARREQMLRDSAPPSTATGAAPATSWWHVAVRVALGQALACCIALTGLFSSLLAQEKTSVSLLQSASAYGMIFALLAPLHFRYSRQRAQRHHAVVTAAGVSGGGDDDDNSATEDPSATRPVLAHGVHGVFSSRFPLWRYFALAVCDVGASYFAIRAYAFTDITSAQLLDAATIVTVVVLGYVVLARRFNRRHYAGLLVAIGGMVALVAIDANNKSRDSDTTAPRPVLGDVLTLIASVLYGVTNVGCEALLKSRDVTLPPCMQRCADAVAESPSRGGAALVTGTAATSAAAGAPAAALATRVVPSVSGPATPTSATSMADRGGAGSEEFAPPHAAQVRRAHTHTPATSYTFDAVVDAFPLIVEYVVFLTLFGLVMSSALLAATSLDDVRAAAARWTWHSTLLQLAFCCAMVGTYVGLPVLLRISTATFACLSLLTADVYAVVLNYVTSGTAPTGWYYLVAAAILGGVVVFDTADAAPSAEQERDLREAIAPEGDDGRMHRPVATAASA